VYIYHIIHNNISYYYYTYTRADCGEREWGVCVCIYIYNKLYLGEGRVYNIRYIIARRWDGFTAARGGGHTSMLCDRFDFIYGRRNILGGLKS